MANYLKSPRQNDLFKITLLTFFNKMILFSYY